jgi:hypothetical protein
MCVSSCREEYDMNAHTQGMLSLGAECCKGTDRVIRIEANDQRLVARVVYDGGREEDYQNAKRLVATWNACKDIPTSKLETEIMQKLVDMVSALVSAYDKPSFKGAEQVRNARILLKQIRE